MFLPTEPQFVLTVQENDGIDLVLQRPIPAMPESERYKDQTRTMLREEEARLSVGATDPTSPVGMVSLDDGTAVNVVELQPCRSLDLVHSSEAFPSSDFTQNTSLLAYLYPVKYSTVLG